MNRTTAPNKSEQDRIEAMLKHSRKRMLQRQNKPLAQHASETLGVGADERQEAAQAGQCALDHEKPANNQADQACCDSVPTPNAVLLPHGIER